MKNKLTKLETEQQISKVFSNNPRKKEIRKVKKLAMSKKLKLTEYKKLFCKKCFSFFNSTNSETRIKKPFKTIKCKGCNYISRYKL